jgi:glycosyltransferase involved in cell wall biosynthesis
MPEAASSTKTRVLFLNSCIHGGGAGRSLVAYLSQEPADIEPLVVLPAPGVIAEQLGPRVQITYVPEFLERIQTSHHPRIDRIPGLNIAYGAATLVSAGQKLVRLVQVLKPDVIYCNHMLAKPVGAYVGAKTGVPVVFHARNIHDWPVEKQFFQYLAQRDCVKSVICNSRASAVPYAAVAEDKVHVVYNFIDLQRFRRDRVSPKLRAEFGIAADAVVVGYLGRIIGWKGIDVLIRAFVDVAASNPKAVLVIVGDNDGGLKTDLRAEYEALAHSLGVGARVIFTGFRDDVVPYVADFDVLALPSVRPEPFGRVIIEAMALGVAPVVTAHGGATEIVTDGQNGLWTAPQSVPALSQALQRLVNDAPLRKTLGFRAALDVRAKFDGKVLSREVTRLLRIAAGHEREPCAAS